VIFSLHLHKSTTTLEDAAKKAEKKTRSKRDVHSMMQVEGGWRKKDEAEQNTLQTEK